MKIGLIADIHANYAALKAVLDELNHQVDQILCAGDLTGYYTEPNRVIQTLLDRQVTFIIGNHDRYIDCPPQNPNALLAASIDLTRSLIRPEFQARLKREKTEWHSKTDGLRLSMFHGSPWDPLEEYIYQDYSDFERFSEVQADVIILGHTHRPFIRWIGDLLIVNPGSCGQPRDGDRRASCAILDTITRQVFIKRFNYDASEPLTAIWENKLDQKLTDYLPVALDQKVLPGVRQ
ncbi:MAG: metallophosphoesterase [Desulfobacca sp.]|nr:metallophosphoesterase [Desulfobacca sp.]